MIYTYVHIYIYTYLVTQKNGISGNALIFCYAQWLSFRDLRDPKASKVQERGPYVGVKEIKPPPKKKKCSTVSRGKDTLDFFSSEFSREKLSTKEILCSESYKTTDNYLPTSEHDHTVASELLSVVDINIKYLLLMSIYIDLSECIDL